MGYRPIVTLHDYFSVCPNGGLFNYQTHQICTKKPMSLACMTCNCDKRSYPQKVWRILRQFPIRHYIRNSKAITFLYIAEFSYSKLKPWLREGAQAVYVRNPYELGGEWRCEAENNQDYLCVGRVSEEKGTDLFCRAVSELKANKKIQGRAIVIGDGELRKELEETYPEIEFVGWKSHEEIEEYMRHARALIFPSRCYEGAPLTPIEFMAHGIPCIASDNCAAVDYIDEYGGIQFKSGDCQALMNGLLIAEDNESWRSIVNQLCESFDRSRFSVDVHICQLKKAYANILNQQRQSYDDRVSH